MSLPSELLAFVDETMWTYAKTMPKWPHEYIVRERVDETLFERLVRYIRTHGYEGKFYQKAITYYGEGGMVYWTMGARYARSQWVARPTSGNRRLHRMEFPRVTVV